MDQPGQEHGEGRLPAPTSTLPNATSVTLGKLFALSEPYFHQD